jgi:hypothetical protein
LVPIPKPWQNKVFFSCFLIYLASTYSTWLIVSIFPLFF